MDETKTVDDIVASHGGNSSDSIALDADDTAVMAQMGKKQQLKVGESYEVHHPSLISCSDGSISCPFSPFPQHCFRPGKHSARKL